jgi:hypothetical protein
MLFEENKQMRLIVALRPAAHSSFLTAVPAAMPDLLFQVVGEAD